MFSRFAADVLDDDSVGVVVASMEFTDSFVVDLRDWRSSRLQVAEEEMRRRLQTGAHESRRHHRLVLSLLL